MTLKAGVSLGERTDSELVALARQGDKDAFGLLTERYQMIARRFAMRLVANDDIAQELAQEAILQAYLSLDRLRDPSRFKSWLCGIVLNVCRSHLRDRNIGFFSLEAMIEGLQLYAVSSLNVPATPERLAEERELYRIVLDVVNSLPSADRDITLLFYYAQLNIQEIGTLLGIKSGTVKVRLHRARQRLKVILQEQHPEILPAERRRKKMIKVTIADVIKVEQKEGQEPPASPYAIVLYDESGRRLMPIWIGPHEGESIAAGLTDFATPRPLTYNFFSSLLQGIDARLEEVRVVALKKDTFYGVVKMRCGKKTSEVDARPSDAIALAVLNDCPIFVAEEVLETAGVVIPETVKGPPTRRGVEKINKGLEEWWGQYQVRTRQQRKKYHEMSQEEKTRRSEEFITAVFGK